MKAFVSVLLALSVLTGVGATSASAAIDAKTFFEQQERQSH